MTFLMKHFYLLLCLNAFEDFTHCTTAKFLPHNRIGKASPRGQIKSTAKLGVVAEKA